MAKRTLESLQKQYAREVHDKRRGPGGGRRGPGGPRDKSKPKHTKDTIKRILNYLYPYRFRLIAVFFCMIVSTLTSLCGSYMLSPIINRIQKEVTGEAPKLTGPGRIADKAITALQNGARNLFGELLSEQFYDIASYILAAVVILGGVYLIGICTAYLELYRESRGIVLSTLVTAEPADEATKALASKVIADYTHKQVELIDKSDPAILGGLSMEFDNNMYDARLSTRLGKLRRAFEENAYESKL